MVFIATPHGGSYQALGFFGRLGSWLVNLPGRFVKFNVDLMTLEARGFTLGTFSGVPTSIDNMSPGNLFIRNLSAIPIARVLWPILLLPSIANGRSMKGPMGS